VWTNPNETVVLAVYSSCSTPILTHPSMKSHAGSCRIAEGWLATHQ
jgi:hypothetical protein